VIFVGLRVSKCDDVTDIPRNMGRRRMELGWAYKSSSAPKNLKKK
jgi:hypothetical protein